MSFCYSGSCLGWKKRKINSLSDSQKMLLYVWESWAEPESQIAQSSLKEIWQQWMSENTTGQAKDTHVYFTWLSHGCLAAKVLHLFGNASASSMPFKQGFSCTNKRKQVPCWNNELPCLWSDTCVEWDKAQKRRAQGLIIWTVLGSWMWT